jgi:hypothetical protein
VQTKLLTPRAKNSSAKLAVAESPRPAARSGVIPDSQAFEKMNGGTRSMRVSSLASPWASAA